MVNSKIVGSEMDSVEVKNMVGCKVSLMGSGVVGVVGTEAWLGGRAGSVYLAGPPSGIAHLVSETFSRRKEPRVRRGRAMEAALHEGTGR